MFDPNLIRSDFPILSRTINGYPLAYLDNAATTQKPRQVVEAIQEYYFNHNANVNRGVHTLAEESTHAYEEARKTVADFIGARPDEIIFVRNTTEALNLVVYGWCLKHLKKGDEVILTQMEHHSNVVPWQMLASRIGIRLKFIAVNEEGELDLGSKIQSTKYPPPLKLRRAGKVQSGIQNANICVENIEVGGLKGLLTERTRFVSLVHVSNTLGTINPVGEIIRQIKKFNKEIVVMVDGAQSVPHMPTNVGTIGRQESRIRNYELGIKENPKQPTFSIPNSQFSIHNSDFLAFSGHKMLGPMGIGVLWGRKQLLESMDPFLGGGDMISSVYLDQTSFNKVPEKFEAGTPNVADAVGLAAAIKYLGGIRNLELGIWKEKPEGATSPLQAIQQHEQMLTKYVLERLAEFKEIKILGPRDIEKRAGLVAFEFAGVHAHDVAQVLDSMGVAVRSGHHCTMPLHKHLKVQASTRVSFYLYNTREEIDRVVEGLEKVKKVFQL